MWRIMAKKGRSGFREGRVGVVLKDGKLYDFGRDYVQVMQVGDDPRSWIKRATHPWKSERKMADEVLCYHLRPADQCPVAPAPSRPAEIPLEKCITDRDSWPEGLTTEEIEVRARRRAWVEWYLAYTHAQFFDTMPPDVRATLLKYRQRRWQLMNLLIRCPGAHELEASNPALAFALANNWVFHKPAVSQPLRAARSLLRRKQRHILGWLGFPATESTVKIFRKVTPDTLDVQTLFYLRGALADKARAKKLAHLPRLNAGVLRLATDPRWVRFCSPRLLAEVAVDPEEDWQPQLYWLLRDCFRMDQETQEHLCPCPFRSREQLLGVHEELTAGYERMLRIGLTAHSIKTLPPPPFQGTASIQPLRTPAELLEEGGTMQHCAAGYCGEVGRGGAYLYRVVAPVRATISIERHADGWTRGQLRGQKNEAIPAALTQQLFHELFSSPRTPPSLEGDPDFLEQELGADAQAMMAEVGPG